MRTEYIKSKVKVYLLYLLRLSLFIFKHWFDDLEFEIVTKRKTKRNLWGYKYYFATLYVQLTNLNLVSCFCYSVISCWLFTGDGGWSPWNKWTGCTKSCGGGVQSRRRYCDSPTPEGEGNYCEGLGTEVISCNTDHCPGTLSSSWIQNPALSVCCHIRFAM